MLFGFTYSKAIDNVGEMTSVAGTRNGPQDDYCLACDRALSDQNEPYSMRMAIRYDLPFGRGRRLVNSGLAARVLGGWSRGAFTTIDAGRPLAVSSPNNSSSFGGGNGMRPNATGASAALPGGPRFCDNCLYFNPAAFTQTPQFAFGNASRYLPDVSNPRGGVQCHQPRDLFRTNQQHHVVHVRQTHSQPGQHTAADPVQSAAGVLGRRMTRTIFAFLLAVCRAAAADTIYINANVLTMDSSRPYAESFGVENSRFTAVGSKTEIRRLAAPGAKVIDLHGMTVTPGFNDAHLHPVGVYDESSAYYTPWLGPERVHNMDELVAALKTKAERTPPGELVSGSRYQDTKLGRHPNRHDLDRVSRQHPIMISHSSGHIVVVNSYVLEKSGVTKDTKDPPGGSFDRDPDGTPNGVIRESARRLLTAVSERSDHVRIPFADQVEGYLRCFREYAAKGITSASIAGGSPQSFRLYTAVRDAGGPVRMGFMFSESSQAAVQAVGLKSGFGDERLRFTSIKVFHGNSMSGRTCWLSELYSDRPGYYGIPPARSQEDLDQAFQSMHDAGFQIATHSNGDREIEMVLTAIERAQARNPRPDPRHRIEHASVMTQALLDRAKKAGVIRSFIRICGSTATSSCPTARSGWR